MSHHFIRFDDVRYSYPNGCEALRGVSFHITHGEHVALVGSNGAGKSTLLLQTNGLLSPTSGRVSIGGIPVGKKSLRIVRQSVGMVFQNPDDQLFMPTVEEDVAFGPTNMGLDKDEIERRVVQALSEVGALHLRKAAPQHLSGGQKKSVSIATVLSMEPSVLVMDEPSATLDPKARRLMMERIGEFTHTILIATHDLDMVRELCRRTIVMSRGNVVADGATDTILNDRELMERCELI